MISKTNFLYHKIGWFLGLFVSFGIFDLGLTPNDLMVKIVLLPHKKIKYILVCISFRSGKNI